MVHLRASHINGCSVCVEMHARELKEADGPDERNFAVAGWPTRRTSATRQLPGEWQVSTATLQPRMTNPAFVLTDAMPALLALHKSTSRTGVPPTTV